MGRTTTMMASTRLKALLVFVVSSNVAGLVFPAKKFAANTLLLPPTSIETPRWFSATSAPAFMLGAALLLVPVSPSHAVDPSIFTNDYGDPFHPLCERHIQVSPDGKTFHYSGTAVGPKNDPVLRGCTPEEIQEFRLRKGAFDGEILAGNRISAGDGIHEGVWEPAKTAKTKLGYEDVDGIRWNDGNKWFVLTKEKSS